MPLSLHLFIHFSLAVVAGLLVGRYYKNIWLGIITGILGGFLIDLDHVLEYFFVFGLNFNIFNFLEGRQFLQSDKIIIIFHAWEWLLILGSLICLFWKKKSFKIFLFALTLGMFVHLCSDVLINQYPPKFYSIIYRAAHHFSAPELLSQEQWARNIKAKGSIGF